MRHARLRSATLGLTLAIGPAACAPAAEQDDPHPSPLVGTWLAVSPSALAGDTLILQGDGVAHGRARALDPQMGRLANWTIGHRLMPGGFCFKDETTWHCQGFRLRGDTLDLANESRTVFLRVTDPGSATRTAARLRTEDFQHARVAAPAPAESVPRVPSGMRRQ